MEPQIPPGRGGGRAREAGSPTCTVRVAVWHRHMAVARLCCVPAQADAHYCSPPRSFLLSPADGMLRAGLLAPQPPCPPLVVLLLLPLPVPSPRCCRCWLLECCTCNSSCCCHFTPPPSSPLTIHAGVAPLAPPCRSFWIDCCCYACLPYFVRQLSGMVIGCLGMSSAPGCLVTSAYYASWLMVPAVTAAYASPQRTQLRRSYRLPEAPCSDQIAYFCW